MERQALEDCLKKQPFRPFRIVMSSGDRYDVRHPEMAMLLKSRLIVALPNGDGDSVPDRTADCSLLQIIGVDDLQPA